MTKIRQTLQQIFSRLHLRPVSLAAKCRLLFGLAIIVVLSFALLVPYLWMAKLTEKSLLDSGRAVVKLLRCGQTQLVGQSGDGLAIPKEFDADTEKTECKAVCWVHFDKTEQKWRQGLTERKIEAIEKLLAAERNNEVFWSDSGGLTVYIQLIRADEQMLASQSSDTVPVYNLGEPIGAMIVTLSGRDTKRTVLLNRACLIFAGIFSGTSAIVIFYIIVQRVILSPIRQLRALVSNVAAGNLEVRCGIRSKDEFQKLGDAINEMLDNLLEGQNKLRQANKQLDDKITELSDRNVELFKANKIKGEFLANMSHEFRTPLNAILGFAEILKEKPADDTEKSKRYAQNIITSGRNLLNMINDLLDLAKAEAGKIELHIEQTSIPELCRGLVAFFSPLTEKQKIKVRLNVDEEIPIIRTDSGKVQQILYNLLSNAVKFTPDGGKIEITAERPNDKTVQISVADTGAGIAEEDREKIFEKFRQADGSLTRNQAGTGLGLAISTELANLLSGKLSLDSEVGKGSTFRLQLPIITSEPDGQ